MDRRRSHASRTGRGGDLGAFSRAGAGLGGRTVRHSRRGPERGDLGADPTGDLTGCHPLHAMLTLAAHRKSEDPREPSVPDPVEHPDDASANASLDPDSSIALVERAKAGDRQALERLIERYLPRLRRWAHGRLPRFARDLAETSDLVQETVVQTFKRVDRFEVRGEGALQAYLRQALMNRIRDEVRRAGRRPEMQELDARQPSRSRSPLEEAVGREALERYEQALARLQPEDREAVIARVEMGMSHQEVADMLGKPTANAARMTVERALVRLAREMKPDS